MPLFSADHERSPAIDHAIDRPVQRTSAVSAVTASSEGRSSRGSGSRPKHAATSTPAAVTRAAPPTQGTLPSADAPPKKTAAATAALPASTTAEARRARHAGRPAPGALHSPSPYHRVRAGRTRCGGRFSRAAALTNRLPCPNHRITARLETSSESSGVSAALLFRDSFTACQPVVVPRSSRSSPSPGSPRSASSCRRLPWRRTARARSRSSPTGSTTFASTSSTRSTATATRSPASGPTSRTTPAPRTRSCARCSTATPTQIAPNDSPGVVHRRSRCTTPHRRRRPCEIRSQRPRRPSTSSPSSVPVPLIVLAGLAGLLLVAGGAGYVARRAQARRDGPPPSE